MCKVEDIMEKIVRQMNLSGDDEIARYLQANPYTPFEYYSYNGEISNDFFREYFYAESAEAQKYKKNLINSLDNSHGKNTLFIVGYQGCGKTTFINSLLEEYSKIRKINTFVMDCDKKGIDERDTLKVLFEQKLAKEFDDENNYINIVDFFQENIDVIQEFANGEKLVRFFKDIMQVNRKYKDPEFLKSQDMILSVKNELHCEIFEKIEKLNFKNIFYILIIAELAKSFRNEQNEFNKLIIVIDNLDYISTYYELKDFINAFDAFTVDFSRKFKNLNFGGSRKKR